MASQYKKGEIQDGPVDRLPCRITCLAGLPYFQSEHLVSALVV